MKTTVEELLLQIVSTALIINQQGKWHAFIDLQGHVSGLGVRVYSADTDYQDKSREAARRDCYWQGKYLSPQACQYELTSILTWLQGYLDMPATPDQEVAA